MFRAALLILSGNAAASLLLLARNLIVARLIPVADYGVAATFAVAMAVVEMMSALGLQQQIVQAKDGDDPRFQAALQGFQLLRGVAAGLVLLALAGPLAGFLGIPEAAWAYRVLALVPVLNALQHFDIHRLNRQMRFGPLIATRAVPAIVAVGALWPLALWWDDWQVMLWSILAQAAAGALASHLWAERPWRLALDRAVIAGSLRFGWPLLANGALMFLVFEGDKVIVGRELGMEALALFAMGMTLTLTPTLVLAASLSNFFLPQLSRADRGTAAGEARFRFLSVVTLQAVLLAALVFVALTAALGGPVVHLLLGDKYLGLLPYLTWFAVMQGLRVIKAGPAIAALAAGRTGNALAANLVRILALPACWHVAAGGGELLTILWLMAAGELAAHAVALGLLLWRLRLPPAGLVLPHLATLGLFAAAAWISFARGAEAAMLPADPAAGLLLAALALLGVWTMPALRRYIRDQRGGDGTA